LQQAPEASVNTGLNRTFLKKKAAFNPYMLPAGLLSVNGLSCQVCNVPVRWLGGSFGFF